MAATNASKTAAGTMVSGSVAFSPNSKTEIWLDARRAPASAAGAPMATPISTRNSFPHDHPDHVFRGWRHANSHFIGPLDYAKREQSVETNTSKQDSQRAEKAG